MTCVWRNMNGRGTAPDLDLTIEQSLIVELSQAQIRRNLRYTNKFVWELYTIHEFYALLLYLLSIKHTFPAGGRHVLFSLSPRHAMCSRSTRNIQPTLVSANVRPILGVVHILRNHFWDFQNVVASGHNILWRPFAANWLLCDFQNVVAFGHNELWRPPAARDSFLNPKCLRNMWTTP